MIIGIKSWAIGVGIATIAAGFLGALVGGWKSSPTPPHDLRECESSAEIISSRESARHCPPGAIVEAWPAGDDRVLVKCICPSVTP